MDVASNTVSLRNGVKGCVEHMLCKAVAMHKLYVFGGSCLHGSNILDNATIQQKQ